MSKRKKGKKAVKGQPMMDYSEVKERINLTLTPTAKDNLDRIATHLNISRSELVERIARAEEGAIIGLLGKDAP